MDEQTIYAKLDPKHTEMYQYILKNTEPRPSMRRLVMHLLRQEYERIKQANDNGKEL